MSLASILQVINQYKEQKRQQEQLASGNNWLRNYESAGSPEEQKLRISQLPNVVQDPAMAEQFERRAFTRDGLRQSIDQSAEMKRAQDFINQNPWIAAPSQAEGQVGRIPTRTEMYQDALAAGTDAGLPPSTVNLAMKSLESFIRPNAKFEKVGDSLYALDEESGNVRTPEGFRVDPYASLPADARAYLAAQTDPRVRQALETQLRDKQKSASAGATKVNVFGETDGPQFGTIPPGFMLNQDESGGYLMQPVSGSPASREALAAEKAARLNMSEAINKGKVVSTNIDKALGKTGLFTTGFFGKITSAFPGSPAYDLGQTIDTVKANIGFDTLQKMRDASPTGGALGQVSERELAQLERVLGSLDQAQSREQLVENLMAVRNHYNNWKATLEEAAADPSAWQPKAKAPAEMTDEELLKALGGR